MDSWYRQHSQATSSEVRHSGATKAVQLRTLQNLMDLDGPHTRLALLILRVAGHLGRSTPYRLWLIWSAAWRVAQPASIHLLGSK
jgi:hypothetical protein